MATISDVKHEDVFKAAKMATLDEAAAHLQKIAGIDTGDVAGQFFDGGDHAPWEQCDPGERVSWLMEYLRTETMFAEVVSNHFVIHTVEISNEIKAASCDAAIAIARKQASEGTVYDLLEREKGVTVISTRLEHFRPHDPLEALRDALAAADNMLAHGRDTMPAADQQQRTQVLAAARKALDQLAPLGDVTVILADGRSRGITYAQWHQITGAAESHLEDLTTAVEDGTYERTENAEPIEVLTDALKAIDMLGEPTTALKAELPDDPMRDAAERRAFGEQMATVTDEVLHAFPDAYVEQMGGGLTAWWIPIEPKPGRYALITHHASDHIGDPEDHNWMAGEYRDNGEDIGHEDELTLAHAISTVRGWIDAIRRERNASGAS